MMIQRMVMHSFFSTIAKKFSKKCRLSDWLHFDIWQKWHSHNLVMVKTIFQFHKTLGYEFSYVPLIRKENIAMKFTYFILKISQFHQFCKHYICLLVFRIKIYQKMSFNVAKMSCFARPWQFFGHQFVTKR